MAYILKQLFCRPGMSNNPNQNMQSISFITIHETDNYASYANAAGHAAYLYEDSDGRAVSWHYTIDASEIWQSFEDYRMCWHCGDKIGNSTSIGVEICVNDRSNFLKACDNAAQLTADLLLLHNLTVDTVVQHDFWTGKDCPNKIRSGEWGITWTQFIQLVKKYYAEASLPPYPGYLIAQGSYGDIVSMIQNYLNTISKSYPAIPTLIVDGDFGPATKLAVIAFQKLFGLTADGIIGSYTWNKIMSVYSDVKTKGYGTSLQIYENTNLTDTKSNIETIDISAGDHVCVPETLPLLIWLLLLNIRVF